MKKIMFNDRYCLTQAVLDGRKTQTRRIITCPKTFKGEDVAGFHVYRRMSDNAILEHPIMYDADERDFDRGYIEPKYNVGEVVAVAQRYSDFMEADKVLYRTVKEVDGYRRELASEQKGWNNKLFVCADLMPHRIRITDVRVERLNDISESDCRAEGIVAWTKDKELYKYDLKDVEMFPWSEKPRTPREAYAALIDKISGKGVWSSNPYVFAYTFELVK